MPNYTELRHIENDADRNRTIDSLFRLRDGLASEIPKRSATDSLLLATWNIREFDSSKFDYREDEPYFYIAEIISRFDLVAVQEVRDLCALHHLQRHLGNWWDFIVTDVNLDRAGNGERMAYLYDRRKVSFTGLAAELVLPGTSDLKKQIARTPYIAGFRTGWAYLTLTTVHIYYGDDDPVNERRLDEIRQLAKTIAKKAPQMSGAPQYEPGQPPKAGNTFILGDFNIFSREDVTFSAITDAEFVVPEQLKDVPGTNVDQTKFYDQIAYHRSLAGLDQTNCGAGVFDFYRYVYRTDDAELYADKHARWPKSRFSEWRTHQMSDHLPMWVEFNTDDSRRYIEAQRGAIS